MPSYPVSPSEFHLLMKEIESQGEWLNQERLDRQAEIDRLRLEVQALRQTLQELLPGFEIEEAKNREELRQNYDPDVERRVKEKPEEPPRRRIGI